MENNQQKKGNKITEGIILAFCSVLAYFVAFLYDYGYAKYFGIPVEFINISITNIFIAVISLALFIFILILLLNLIIILMPERTGPIGKQILMLSPMYLYTFCILIIYAKHVNEWLTAIVASVIITIFVFVFPLVTQKNKRTYKEKLEAQDEIDRNIPTFFGYIYRLLGKWGYYGLILVYIVTTASYNAGRASAIDKKEYLVSSTKPETVVLKSYGDTLICAYFDYNKKEIYRNFLFIKLDGESKSLNFRMEEIGPMSVVDFVYYSP